jgi:hypothetical protein
MPVQTQAGMNAPSDTTAAVYVRITGD